MTIQRLYKYGKINKHSEKLFTGNKVYFSSLDELNDPFECRPIFDPSCTKSQYVEFFVGDARRNNPNVAKSTIQRDAEERFDGGITKNPAARQVMVEGLINVVKTKFGFYCMSVKRDDILMFSHYGDGHRGYCLEFNVSDTTSVFGYAQEMEYNHKYPTVTAFDDTKKEKFDKTFLTKFIGWEYEKEYRIIDPEGGSGLKEYPKELLKGVIFGVSMKESDKNQIRSWLRVRGGEVQLYQADIRDDKFALTINPID